MKDKTTLIKLVIAKLETENKDAEQALLTIRQGSIEAPGAMQSHSDTTKFQMGALADELQGSIENRLRAISDLRKFIASDSTENPAQILEGSVVTIKNEMSADEARYFLFSRAGGTEIGDNGDRITVITLQSPLGVALLGKRINETINFPTPGNPNVIKNLRVIAIQ